MVDVINQLGVIMDSQLLVDTSTHVYDPKFLYMILAPTDGRSDRASPDGQILISYRNPVLALYGEVASFYTTSLAVIGGPRLATRSVAP